jgi:hypothetical protein
LLGIFHVSNIRETRENRRILRAKIQFSYSESFTIFLGTLLLKIR